MEIRFVFDAAVIAAGMIGGFLLLLGVAGFLADLIWPHVYDIICFFERKPAVREEDKYRRGDRE